MLPISENQPTSATNEISEPIAIALRGPVRPDLLRDETLPELFTATALSAPENIALVWKQRSISYGELDRISRSIAAALAQRGAAPRKVIGLLLPRGADLLIAQLSIAQSGAAWLPFDAETPVERVRVCLQSAGAIGLVTCEACLSRMTDLPAPVWTVENLLADDSPHTALATPQPSDPAYVIYTSGSTGTPKGIVISHRSICHFLRAENELLGVRSTDRVYQGFSVAFDMSFEEIWISYLVGATLWIAPPEIVSDPEALAAALCHEQITILHVVPTLLGLISTPLIGIRVINLGGEACPDALAQRLAGKIPGQKIFNTYGPTEASVSASLAELCPGESVTIGLPLPNYGMLVVDEQRRPLPAGEVGELCIFGPGLATGYLALPALTAERFVPNPLAANPTEALMYLTGDLARIDDGGPVHCLGRTDHQVKIRGFRVELDEISAALSKQPGVATAAVVLRDLADNDELVAFVIASNNTPLDTAALRQALLASLPRYMVPAHIETVVALPRLTSGKVDLKALRNQPLTISAPTSSAEVKPSTPEETVLFSALEKILPGRALYPDADFFDDLGGHSLLVARLVSLLRHHADFVTIGVQDIYRERRLSAIALTMARLARHAANHSSAAPHNVRAAVPDRRRWLCGLAQAVVLPFFITLNIADWLAPFFVYHYFTGDPDDSIPLAITYSLFAFVLARVSNFAIAILGKRFIAGKLAAGRYPLWGLTYFRWWLGTRFVEMPDAYLITSTPWIVLYLRALGANIGRDVLIDSVNISAPELLTIEDGAGIGTAVNIENARVEAGELIVGPVTLRTESIIDSYSVLENDIEIGAHATLGGQSALGPGTKIPAGEFWEGAPARKTDRVQKPLPPRPIVSFWQRWSIACLFIFTALFVSILFFLPAFPTFLLLDWIDVNNLNIFETDAGPLMMFGYIFLLAAPAAALFVIITMLVTGSLRYFMPRQTAGIFPINSVAFWRKKFMGQILDGSLHELHGIFASVYAPMWMRFLGVKVGRNSEISTAEGIVPDLLTLGEDCFIADGAMLGDEEQRGGWMILQPTVIGNRSFIGNGAYVADGSVVPDDVLIGVQTRTPDNSELHPHQTWMGSPPILLPAREQIAGFPDSLTFRPAPARRIARGIVEALRIIVPNALVIAAGYTIVSLVLPITEEYGFYGHAVAVLALAACAFGLLSFLFVVALKWILIGRYRQHAAPMWTSFVWRSEAVTNLYESLAVPNFLNDLCGTPMLPFALRLLGVHIGRGVFMDTTDITEFDCVRIGDGAELNAHCGPQTHLFEDRVMKIGYVDIGAHVTVGARTVILYDSAVGDNVRLGPLTLVAKGERLPAGTNWTGTPASPST